MIGQRLKMASAAAGLSLRELQEKIGNLVTAQMIGRYERDEAMPGSAVLIALADALDVSENYLVDQSDLRLEASSSGKTGSRAAKEEASVEATVLDAVERYLTIEDLVGAASAAWTPPLGAPFPVRSLDEAEAAAARLRTLWNLGLDTIPNLAEFLEERGIKVMVIPLPRSGLGIGLQGPPAHGPIRAGHCRQRGRHGRTPTPDDRPRARPCDARCPRGCRRGKSRLSLRQRLSYSGGGFVGRGWPTPPGHRGRRAWSNSRRSSASVPRPLHTAAKSSVSLALACIEASSNPSRGSAGDHRRIMSPMPCRRKIRGDFIVFATGLLPKALYPKPRPPSCCGSACGNSTLPWNKLPRPDPHAHSGLRHIGPDRLGTRSTP